MYTKLNLWGSTDPTLVPGFGKYEKYDAGWLRCLTEYQESQRVPFPVGGTVIDIGDTITIAIAGDMGNGITTNVSAIIAELNADYTIHLGDTYYTGNWQENGIFATDWPAGSRGSFALPGNHDMYSGGGGYLQTLTYPKFAAQGGKSYFSLRNKNWLIVGLDTSSASTDWLYKNGALDNEQLTWLTNLLADADQRKLILLSHHDGFNLDVLDETGTGNKGIIYKPLWSDILLTGWRPKRWYWGHVHSPVIYSNNCRCIGHSGVPYLPFTGFYKDYGDTNVKVLWAETDNALTGNLLRAPNGFAVIRLDGDIITEQVIDEEGRSRWQST